MYFLRDNLQPHICPFFSRENPLPREMSLLDCNMFDYSCVLSKTIEKDVPFSVYSSLTA